MAEELRPGAGKRRACALHFGGAAFTGLLALWLMSTPNRWDVAILALAALTGMHVCLAVLHGSSDDE